MNPRPLLFGLGASLRNPISARSHRRAEANGRKNARQDDAGSNIRTNAFTSAHRGYRASANTVEPMHWLPFSSLTSEAEHGNEPVPLVDSDAQTAELGEAERSRKSHALT